MAKLTPEQLAELALTPKEDEIEDRRTLQRDAKDVLALDQAASETAAATRSRLPIRFMQTRPPGAS